MTRIELADEYIATVVMDAFDAGARRLPGVELDRINERLEFDDLTEPADLDTALAQLDTYDDPHLSEAVAEARRVLDDI